MVLTKLPGKKGICRRPDSESLFLRDEGSLDHCSGTGVQFDGDSDREFQEDGRAFLEFTFYLPSEIGGIENLEAFNQILEPVAPFKHTVNCRARHTDAIVRYLDVEMILHLAHRNANRRHANLWRGTMFDRIFDQWLKREAGDLHVLNFNLLLYSETIAEACLFNFKIILDEAEFILQADEVPL